MLDKTDQTWSKQVVIELETQVLGLPQTLGDCPGSGSVPVDRYPDNVARFD